MLCILKTFTNCFRLERMGFECRRRRQRPIISSTRSKHSWTVDTQLHDINDNNYVAKSIHCCMVTVWYNFAILIVVSVSDHRRQKRHFIFCIFPFRLEPVGESVTDIRLSNDEIVPRQKGVRRWKTQFFPLAHTMKLSSWVKNVATQITSLLPTSDDSIRLFFLDSFRIYILRDGNYANAFASWRTKWAITCTHFFFPNQHHIEVHRNTWKRRRINSTICSTISLL